jgi:hypothetical protein
MPHEVGPTAFPKGHFVSIISELGKLIGEKSEE